VDDHGERKTLDIDALTVQVTLIGPLPRGRGLVWLEYGRFR